MTEWQPGKTVSAVRNPGYYNPDRPLLDGTHFIEIVRRPNRLPDRLRAEAGRQFQRPGPGNDHRDPRCEQETTRSFGTRGKCQHCGDVPATHCKRRGPIVRLIRAMNLAMDRRQLIQQLHNGLGKVSGPVSWLQEAWAIPQTEMETTPGYRDRQRGGPYRGSGALGCCGWR